MLGKLFTALSLIALSASASAFGDDAALLQSLKKGDAGLKSATALTFGPAGILFVADPAAGAVSALDTEDRTEIATQRNYKVEGLDQKVGALLGTTPQDLLINDLAVNPLSGRLYLSVSRGRGPDATPVIVKVNPGGSFENLDLTQIANARVTFADADRKKRQEAITDLMYIDGKLFVAGLSNEEFSSRLRTVPFPFAEGTPGTGVEIFHGAHGKLETASPVRTFTSYKIQGQPNILAAYTCTPLVKIPLTDLKPGAKIRGTTIAELGNRNRPLDMVPYTKDGQDYLLIANSSRGVMKVKLSGIADAEGINKRINNTAGLPYETVRELRGVEQLDKLSNTHAVLIVKQDNGSIDLETIPLP